jgi:hypothetical protein
VHRSVKDNPRYRRNATPPKTGGIGCDGPPIQHHHERGVVEEAEYSASANLVRMVIGAQDGTSS